MRALVTILFACLTTIAGGMTPAAADSPTVPWVGDNPYVWTMGDSIIQQGGEEAGLGWRSLGFIGWPGADTSMMRGRIEGTLSPDAWPAWTVTESSLEEERLWFRDAGSWLIGLGTNDVKTMDAEQFRDNVDWFMEQSRGRPVMWFNIVNRPFQAQTDQFNAVLEDAADRWGNLKVIDWAQWVQHNPGALMNDGVHIATGFGYDQGRYPLARTAAPEITHGTPPLGYWYWNPPTNGGRFGLNGWAATNLPNREGPLWLNVRVDWQHVGRFLVTNPTGDLWAQTASGHGFGVDIGPEWAGRYFCLDLYDQAEQVTRLGCRTVG